ncbi:MAG: PHP domain-containing protein [Spirochaetes bacterium]|nr:PHP domain-containing protein [Spirochaetota bacterium]
MKIAADLHIHSTLSPCGSLESTPRAIVEWALERHLDMIAVTDHNSVENALHASAYGALRGLSVICGMEAQTSEDVHLLCLLPNPRAAEAFYSRAYPFLPDVANNPDYFGDQVVVDIDDTIVRVEAKLLLNSLDLSIGALEDLVLEFGGFIIPSHVESPHSSLLANLGFLPPELVDCPLEISYCTSFSAAIAAHPELAGRRLLCNSDAHFLADIGRVYTVYDVDEATLASVYQAAQSGRYHVVRKEG